MGNIVHPVYIGYNQNITVGSQVHDGEVYIVMPGDVGPGQAMDVQNSGTVYRVIVPAQFGPGSAWRVQPPPVGLLDVMVPSGVMAGGVFEVQHLGRTESFIVPDGFGPGSSIQVPWPDSNHGFELLDVTVPAGVAPGQGMDVDHSGVMHQLIVPQGFWPGSILRVLLLGFVPWCMLDSEPQILAVPLPEASLQADLDAFSGMTTTSVESAVAVTLTDKQYYEAVLKIQGSMAKSNMGQVDLHKLFRLIDTDNSGDLDVAELQRFCGAAHLDIDNHTLTGFFSRLDIDKNGLVSFEEFATALNIIVPDITRPIKITDNEYKHVLNQIKVALNQIPDFAESYRMVVDTDGSGDVDIFELQKFCMEMRITVDPTTLIGVFQRLDTDRNGAISFKEFFALTDTEYKEVLSKIKPKLHDDSIDGIEKLFRILDTDGTGDLDIFELHRFCSSLQVHLSTTTLLGFFHRLDAAGKSWISLEDFCEALEAKGFLASVKKRMSSFKLSKGNSVGAGSPTGAGSTKRFSSFSLRG